MAARRGSLRAPTRAPTTTDIVIVAYDPSRLPGSSPATAS